MTRVLTLDHWRVFSLFASLLIRLNMVLGRSMAFVSCLALVYDGLGPRLLLPTLRQDGTRLVCL